MLGLKLIHVSKRTLVRNTDISSTEILSRKLLLCHLNIHNTTVISSDAPTISMTFYYRGFTYIPKRISNYIHYKACDELTYPFQNINDWTIDIWLWINNIIPDFTGRTIAYLCWNWTCCMLIKGGSGGRLNLKRRLSNIGIPFINIRQSWDHLIVLMEMSILIRRLIAYNSFIIWPMGLRFCT